MQRRQGGRLRKVSDERGLGIRNTGKDILGLEYGIAFGGACGFGLRERNDMQECRDTHEYHD
jgi:hypothetical protein